MPSTRRLRHLLLALLLLLGLVALSLVYWGVARPDVLLREDNPRLVEAELRIQRGQILDTVDTVLALSQVDDPTAFPPSRVRRLYPVADAGPAVGYYSFRFGTAGVEDGLDDLLRGTRTTLEALRHEPQVGSDLRLTLNALWQQEADRLLGARRGAVILMTLPDGAIRAMVSHPTYDPNLLEAEFETLLADDAAPLLNRATQGLYQPGMMVAPLVLATAYDAGDVRYATPVEEADRPVAIDGTTRHCAEMPPTPATYRDALRAVCPAPLVGLAEASWSATDMGELWRRFGLYDARTLPVAVEVGPDDAVADVGLAAIGQENLTLSPLNLLLAFGALANGGVAPQPRLVEAVRAPGEAWMPFARERVAAPQPLSTAAAAATLEALPRQDGVAEYAVLVLSGPAGTENSWYVGLAPAGAPQYAVVVVVEEADERLTAAAVGRELLARVLSAP